MYNSNLGKFMEDLPEKAEAIENSNIRKQYELLEELQNNFKLAHASEYQDLVNYGPKSDEEIHRWFKYREGYSLKLIEKLLEEDDEVILDPFVGSGTTLLQSKLEGKESLGIDINPISVLISRVKTRNYTENELDQISSKLEEVLNLKNNGDVPALRITDKSFNDDILEELLKIRENIKTLEDTKIKDFLLVGFLAIIEDVSNTYKEGNGIKYKFTKRRSDGYEQLPQEEWENDNFPEDKKEFVRNKLSDKIKQMKKDVGETSDGLPEPEVHRSDSTDFSELIEKEVDVTIFSPPYCNCFDYFEIFKLELWVGEFVESYKEMRELKGSSLRSNIGANLDKPEEEFESLEEFISLINPENLWDDRILNVIRGYFTDMKSNLEDIKEVSAEGGRCYIVVGNSAYDSVLIPSDLILSEIAEEVGFEVKSIQMARHLTTSSQQKKDLEPIKGYLRESIIELEVIE